MIRTKISHYKILTEIGQGGMGVVYKAVDTRLNRTVALKFLPATLTRDAEAKKRFVQEAQAAAALNHPNICTVYEIDEADGQPFIAMEYIDGQNLQEKIKLGPLEIDEVLEIAIHVAEGLREAHAQGIIHRDIKSANIMITSDGLVKILDFGLAKLLNQANPTHDSATVGTAAYMSPEQINGEPVDHRTDIWSFGVVLYQMLTGHLPFEGAYEVAVLYSVLNEQPAPLTDYPIEHPDAWQPILDQCLAKNAEQRYQTVQEMMSDLLRVKDQLYFSRNVPGAANMVKPAYRLRKPVTVGLAVLIGVALLTAFYFKALRNPQPFQPIPIAVIDFKNETSESELNGLSGMLITALEQSPRLQVLTRSRMFDILRMAGLNDVSYIDEVLGRKICRAAHIDLLALAAIRKFGNVYAIDFKILDVKRNRYMCAVKVQGSGKESIPSLIDQLSEKTRSKLQEKTADIQSSFQRVSQVTTPNLEAYYHYFKGQEYIDKLKFTSALKEFKQAIALDSTFGMAYYRLAYATGWIGGSEEASYHYINKAMRYLDRVPLKEQYLVRTDQSQWTRGFEAGIKILKEMEQSYPKNKEMLYNIGDWSYHAMLLKQAKNYLLKVYHMDSLHIRTVEHLTWTFRDLGDYPQMVRMAWCYFTIAPSSESFDLLAQAYAGAYGPAEGLERLKQLEKRSAQNKYQPFVKANLLLLQDRYDEAEKLILPLATDSQTPDMPLQARMALGNIYLYQGRYREALLQTDALENFFWQRKDTTLACYWKVYGALIQFEGWHNAQKAWEKAATTFVWPQQILHGYYWAGLSLLAVHSGRYGLAREYAHKMQQKFWDKVIDILILLNKKELKRALALTDTLFTYRRSFTVPLILFPLGQLQSEKGFFTQADEALRRIRDNDDNSFYFRAAYYAKTFYWQGRIAEAQGERRRAQKYYRRFLQLWQKADDDLPELKDARQRLARISGKQPPVVNLQKG